MIECKLTHRNAIGYDINPDAVRLTRKRLVFEFPSPTSQTCRKADARKLPLKEESIDLILLHPPYADIIKYSEGIKGDLSQIHKVGEFADEIQKVADQCMRVLKKNGFCAVMMGDTRRKKYYIPIAYEAMGCFLKAGFVLKEDIIKVQHNCKATGFWVRKSKEYNFLLIMHEHIFVFHKTD